MRPHPAWRVGNQIIVARSEQPLDVVPAHRDQRHAAGQRLEHADGWYARQRLHVWTPGNVHGHAMPRVGERRLVVGQPSSVTNPGVDQFGQGIARIPDAVHGCRESERTNWLDQIRPELRGSLLVTPIANPYQVVLRAVGFERSEDARVGGFMPREGTARPPE